MIKTELPYWMALAHIGGWKTDKINQLVVAIISEHRTTFEDFFNLSAGDWAKEFKLTVPDIQKLLALISDLPNYSFLAENLLDQGYQIIPLNSPDYSETLKRNLKIKYSPTILYVKGNKELLQEKAVAIVGSRKASPEGLEFTEARAQIAVGENKVVVSGFAPGVDQYALESALKYGGKSIIVLPQGITTFTSGFNKFYQQIWEGDVLILSTFHPKARWTAQLAMSRNPIIYGIADEVYIADCEEKSGTWAGVMDGLRKGRSIYVRKPLPEEKNANMLLVQKGASPVDSVQRTSIPLPSIVSETKEKTYENSDNLQQRIRKLLGDSKELTAKQIIDCLKLTISDKKLISLLKKYPEIEEIRHKTYKFRIRKSEIQQPQLF